MKHTIESVLADNTLSNYGKMDRLDEINLTSGIKYPYRYVITNSHDINHAGKQSFGRKDLALAYAKLALADGLPNTEVLDTATQTWMS